MGADAVLSSLDPRPFWPREEGSGVLPCPKCLERWNAAVGVDIDDTVRPYYIIYGVDEGKNTFQPTGIRVRLMIGSE